MDNDGLKKIDLLRERMGIGYQEAAELLRLTEGSVVDALVLAEARQRKTGTTWEVRARDAAGKLREVLREGNITKVRISHKGREVLVFPVTAGVVGALIMPKLALAAAAVCLLGRCRIEVDREASESGGMMPEIPHGN